MSTPTEWPDSGLDIEGLRVHGVRAVPFSEFVLKVASRCNLSCDYCYVYNLNDTSWRGAPRFMSPETCRSAAERIVRHLDTHALGTVQICLHGGEPLLAGKDRIEGLVAMIRSIVEPVASVEIVLQTNGTLLDREWLECLARLDVSVGVSLDGDAETHDRHRRDRRGRPSRAKVERGLRLLASDPYRQLYRGLLAVIDLSAPPTDFYESLLDFSPPRLDLLLPHATWSSPPPRPSGSGPTPYADWLIAIFEHWYAAPVATTSIRIFEGIIDLLLGGRGSGELLGLAPLGYTIIDTDGSYRQSDALNAAYDGCSFTGLDVFQNDVDALLDLPGTVARQIGRSALAERCLSCELVEICGGGHYGHRYRSGSGFLNPSVYCADLMALIHHLRARCTADLRAAAQAGLRC
jgi:uncharacterized protein